MRLNDKSAFRKLVRSRCPEKNEHMAQSERVCQRLLTWLNEKRPTILAAYMPIRQEADILPLIERWLKQGGHLALPRVEGELMQFYAVNGLNELVKGAYGILQPDQDAKPVHPHEISVMLIPLQAVDCKGNRLGKGGGYYDRYLPQCRCIRAGIALEHQLVDEIPTEPWDERIDVLFMPNETIYFGQG